MQSGPKSLGDICYGQGGGAHKYFFHTSERVRLYGASYGAGPRGVVWANDVPTPSARKPVLHGSSLVTASTS